MPALAETLREVRIALTAGYVWLLGIWLIVGDAVLDAAGRNCGDLQGVGCEQVQSEGVELIIDAIDVVGPVGQTAALTVLAALLGSTVNYLLMELVVFKWKDAPEFLMGWTGAHELGVRSTDPGRADELGRRRAETMLRVQLVLPMLFLGFVLAVRLSPWWLAATLPLAVLLAVHGRRSFERYQITAGLTTGQQA